MHRRQLFAALAVSLLFAFGAPAQTQPDAGTPAAPGGAAAPARKSTKPTTKKKSSKKKKKAPRKGQVDEATRKALEAAQPPAPPAGVTTPAPAAPQPPPEAVAVPEAVPAGPPDDEPPQLSSTAVTKATRGKAFTVTARATDASGVFGPVLYLRKKGLPSSEYIPIRMTPSKTGAAGEYSLEIPAALVSADALEYYIEVWDNAGNGPVRFGSADAPVTVKVEEPPKAVAPPVVVKPKGAPPAITHSAVTQGTRGKPIELNARLVGDTGVSGATVMFRHVGEKEYKALPMGHLGADDYTATVPAGMATSDIEYYVEAFDRFGNGPGRSGAPNVPYLIKVSEPVAIKQVPVAPPPPQRVKAPFRPNPGRAAGWLMMGGFVGSLAFAGGNALAALQAHDSYTHTFTYEGRVDSALLARANTYGSRTKTSLIVAGATLVAGIVLLVVFPEYPDTVLSGGGGDLAVRF